MGYREIGTTEDGLKAGRDFVAAPKLREVLACADIGVRRHAGISVLGCMRANTTPNATGFQCGS